MKIEDNISLASPVSHVFLVALLIGLSFNAVRAQSTPGQALNCDGLNDYVDPNVLVTTFTNNFTYEVWVRPTSTHQIDFPSTAMNYDGMSGQKYLLWPTWRGSVGGIGLSVGTNGVSVYEHGSNFINALLVWQGTVSA